MRYFLTIAIALTSSPALACITDDEARGNATFFTVVRVMGQGAACDILVEGTASPTDHKYLKAAMNMVNGHSDRTIPMMEPYKNYISKDDGEWNAYVGSMVKVMTDDLIRGTSIIDCKNAYKENTGRYLEWEEFEKFIDLVSFPANKDLEICE